MKFRKHIVTKKTYSAIQGIINKTLKGKECVLIFTYKNLNGNTETEIKFYNKITLIIHPYQMFENDKRYIIETFNNECIVLKTSPTESLMINIVGKADENCKENVLEVRW